jgi:hypothetical protein
MEADGEHTEEEPGLVRFDHYAWDRMRCVCNPADAMCVSGARQAGCSRLVHARSNLALGEGSLCWVGAGLWSKG